MKARILLQILCICLISSLFSSNYAESARDKEKSQSNFNLTILHTNDTHSHVEQYSLLKSAVDEIRNDYPNALLLSAGDVFTGTLYFNEYLGQADLYFMNKLKYDAMTLGNHEFDTGSKVLAKFIKKAHFPIVSSNIDFAGDPYLGRLVEDPKEAKHKDGRIYPFLIKEIEGERIGIFGLTTEDTIEMSNPSEEIVFYDSFAKAKETVQHFKSIGINKIILLSHLGYKVDKRLAKEVDGIDIIVGGHSHTKKRKPKVIKKKEPTIIVQAGSDLKYLGYVNVTFDKNGIIAKNFGKLIPLDEETFEKDPDFEEKIQKFKARLEKIMMKIVGETKVRLNGERDDVRTKETNLGNLITDAFVWNAQKILPETMIAFHNGGSIRASIPRGKITMGALRTVLPYEFRLVALKLTGKEVHDVLEHSVSNYPNKWGGFLQVSGIRFEFNPKKPPGSRVSKIEVRNQEGKYVPLNKEAYYTVVTNSYIAEGGDGYDILKKAKQDGRSINLKVIDYKVLNKYLSKTGPAAPKVEGRIKKTGK